MKSHYLKNAKTFGWGNLILPNPHKANILRRYAQGSCLDLACGSGVYTNLLNQLNHPVTGVDIYPEFIARARQKYPQINFVKTNILKIHQTKLRADTAVLFDILEHIDDRQLLINLHKNTNRVIISVPLVTPPFLSNHALAFAHHLDLTHKRYYTKSSLHTLLSQTGWKPIRIIEDMPISLSTTLIDHLAHNNRLKKILLKILLKPFLPEKPLYTTLFAVAKKA